jgi:hypothetical protein
MQRSARLRDGGNFFLEQVPDENSRQDGGERGRETGFHECSLRLAPFRPLQGDIRTGRERCPISFT